MTGAPGGRDAPPAAAADGDDGRLEPPVIAVALDFNGTLSDDEPLLCAIYSALVRERLGGELTSQEYYGVLAGLSDREIVERLVARSGRAGDTRLAAGLLEEKIARYQAEVRSQPRIGVEARTLVAELARRVPVAVVTGAARVEVEAALEAAGLAGAVATVVAAEDVRHGKPHPEGYETALRRLGGLEPARAVAVEDSVAGLRAARAAGMQTVAVAGTADRDRLAAQAAVVIGRLSLDEAAALLGALGPARGVPARREARAEERRNDG